MYDWYEELLFKAIWIIAGCCTAQMWKNDYVLRFRHMGVLCSSCYRVHRGQKPPISCWPSTTLRNKNECRSRNADLGSLRYDGRWIRGLVYGALEKPRSVEYLGMASLTGKPRRLQHAMKRDKREDSYTGQTPTYQSLRTTRELVKNRRGHRNDPWCADL
jgi:hypothetical protein